jgi:hypothetical protein
MIPTQTHGQQSDLISLPFFFQNKERKQIKMHREIWSLPPPTKKETTLSLYVDGGKALKCILTN